MGCTLHVYEAVVYLGRAGLAELLGGAKGCGDGSAAGMLSHWRQRGGRSFRGRRACDGEGSGNAQDAAEQQSLVARRLWCGLLASSSRPVKLATGRAMPRGVAWAQRGCSRHGAPSASRGHGHAPATLPRRCDECAVKARREMRFTGCGSQGAGSAGRWKAVGAPSQRQRQSTAPARDG